MAELTVMIKVAEIKLWTVIIKAAWTGIIKAVSTVMSKSTSDDEGFVVVDEQGCIDGYSVW